MDANNWCFEVTEMENKKIISILIPVYNTADKIERCLASIFSNEIIDKCEVILVNDCSTDNSLEVINNFLDKNPPCKIKIISHTKNMGLACARISAFSEAKGEYVICVDSDDWVEKDYLSELYDSAINSNADIVGCDTYVDFKDKQIIRKQNLKETGRECLRSLLIGETPGFVWIKMFRRQFALENNLNWIPNINMFEDVVFVSQMFYYAKKVSYIERPLYHYVQNEGSYTNSKIDENKAYQLVSAVNFINDFLEEKNEKELLELLKIEKLNTKMWILFMGNRNARNKYFSLWENCNDCIKMLKTRFARKVVLKESVNNPALARFLLFLSRIRRNLKNILHKKQIN